jgi:hypothetical protein
MAKKAWQLERFLQKPDFSVDSSGANRCVRRVSCFLLIFNENAMKMAVTAVLLLAQLFAVMPVLPGCAGSTVRGTIEVDPKGKPSFKIEFEHIFSGLPVIMNVSTVAVNDHPSGWIGVGDMPELFAGEGDHLFSIDDGNKLDTAEANGDYYYQLRIENGNMAGTTYTFADTPGMYSAFAAAIADMGITDQEQLKDFQNLTNSFAAHWMSPTDFNSFFGH